MNKLNVGAFGFFRKETRAKSISFILLVAIIAPWQAFADDVIFREIDNFRFHNYIPDQSQVSNNGAYSRAYPIAVPPGRKKVTPELQVSYSSQNTRQDSIVGYGWSLNIPYIERVNKIGVDRLYDQDLTHTFFSSSLSGELLPIGTTTSVNGSVLGISISTPRLLALQELAFAEFADIATSSVSSAATDIPAVDTAPISDFSSTSAVDETALGASLVPNSTPTTDTFVAAPASSAAVDFSNLPIKAVTDDASLEAMPVAKDSLVQPNGGVTVRGIGSELLGERTATSKTFFYGYRRDGTPDVRTRLYTEPVHYKNLKTGQLDNIDTRVATTTSGFRMTHAPYQFDLDTKGTGHFLTVQHDGQLFSVDPVSGTEKRSRGNAALADASTTGRSVLYPDLLGAGIDMQVTALDHLLVKEAIIRDASAIAGVSGDYLEIPFLLSFASPVTVSSNGATLASDTPLVSSSTVALTDTSGVTTFILPPTASASGADKASSSAMQIPIDIAYTATTSGFVMTKRIPLSFLKTATYPVRTDATFSFAVAANSGDGAVEDTTCANGWTECRPSASGNILTKADTNTWARAATDGTGNTRVLISRVFMPFDTRSLATGSAVLAATLYIKAGAIDSATTSMALIQTTQATSSDLALSDYDNLTLNNPPEGAARRNSTDWSGGGYVGWTLNATGTSFVNPGGYTFLGIREATHDVDNVATANNTYYGVYYTMNEAGVGSAPYLEVTTGVSSGFNLLVEAQTNPTIVSTGTPRFSAVFVGATSTAIATQYEIQVSTSSTSWSSLVWDSNQTSLPSSTASNVRTPDITYGGTALPIDRTKYYWRIRFWDQNGVGDWSTTGDYFVMNGNTDYSAKVEQGDFLRYSHTLQDTWYAYDKKGTRYNFGTASTSRIQNAATTTQIFRWYLDSTIDTSGNTISYSYASDSNQAYPSKIVYTGNGTSTPIGEVNLLYESRSDIATSSAPGFVVATKLRLKTILVSANSKLTHQYQFTYTVGDNGVRSLLRSIQESGWNANTGTTTLPATIFGYSTSTYSWTENTDVNKWQFTTPGYFVDDKGGDLGYRVVDANGDGRVDLVNGTTAAYLNNGSTWVLSSSYVLPLLSTGVDDGVRMADVNGDGIVDQLQGVKGNPDAHPTPADINNVYLGSTSGWGLSSMKLPSLFASGFVNGGQARYPTHIVDINGDGLADVIDDYNLVDTSDGAQWIRDSRWTIPVSFPAAGSTYWNQQTVDVNGDGLLDIVGISGVYLNTSIGWVLTPWTMPFSLQGNERFTDINNDGLVDVVKNTTVYTNTGAGWTAQGGGVPVAPYYDGGGAFLPQDQGVSFDDINGDGLSDTIQSRFHYGTNFVVVPDKHVYLKNGNRPDLLSYVSTERGGNTAVTYKQMTMAFSVEVTNSVVTTPGFGGTVSSIGYDYTDGDYYTHYASPVERQFLGFRTMTATDSLGNITTSYFHQRAGVDSANGEYNDALSKAGKTYRVEKKDSFGNLFSRSVYKWARADYGDGRNFVKLLQSLAQTFDGDSSHRDTAASTTYDDKTGNPTLRGDYGEVYGSGDGTFVDVGTDMATSSYSYAVNSAISTSTLSLPSRELIFDQLGNAVRDTRWYYDGLTLGQATQGNQTKQESGIGLQVSQTQADPNLASWVLSSSWGGYSDAGVSTAQHRQIAMADTFYSNQWSKLTKIITGLTAGKSYHVQASVYARNYCSSPASLIVDGNTIATAYVQNSSATLDGSFVAASTSATIDVLMNYSCSGNQSGKYWEGWGFGLSAAPASISSYSTIQKTYNSYGNVSTSIDPRGGTTTYSYDAFNLFPATITNALGQYQTFTYDYATGKIATTTDANGRIFATLYDGLGRPTLEKQPDLSTPTTLVTKASYQYSDTTTTPSYALKKSYLNAATSSDTYAYADGLGRTIQTKTEAEPANGWVTADTIYNNIGSVGSQSLPYFTSSSLYGTATTTSYLYANFSYDPEGRVLTQSDVLGTTTNAYNDWRLRVTDPLGNKKDLWKDARGNLANVVEYLSSTSAATTTYAWNLLGKLTKLTDASTNVRNFTYDTLGRLLTSEDLHSTGDSTYGTSSWAYDDANNVVSFVNPRVQTVNYSYDALNRVKTEDYTGQSGTEIAYSYDTGTDGIGRLTQVAYQGNATTTYSYNPLGLTVSDAKKIGTSWGTTTTSYLRNAAVDTLIYPDASQVANIYDDAGLLDKVTNKEPSIATTTVISSVGYAPTGQTAVIAYANGMIATSTYDATKKYRLTGKLTKGANTLQNIAYTYDAVGDMTQLSDIASSAARKTVNYSYDALYRLLSASTTAVATGTNSYLQSWTYDVLGNILTSPSGTYSYGQTGYANPDAATAIVASSNCSTSSNIFFDASSSPATQWGTGTTSTTTWTHSTSGSNRLLVLVTSIEQKNGVGTVASATYGGQTLTKASSGIGGGMSTEVWYLKNPASGANTMSVVVSGTTYTLKMTSESFVGVDQSSPYDSSSNTAGSSGNPTLSLTTSLQGELVLAALNRYSYAFATSTKTTINRNTDGFTFAAQSFQVGGAAGSYADTYNGATTSRDYSMVMSSFKPAVVGCYSYSSTALDTVSMPASQFGVATTSTTTWTHTTGGTNRLLVLTSAIEQKNGYGTISSATYGGQALTKLLYAPGTWGMPSEIWYLINPPLGANTMSVVANGPMYTMKLSSISFTGIDQSTPVDLYANSTDINNKPGVNLTTRYQNDLILSLLNRYTSTVATSSLTSIYRNTDGYTLQAANYQLGAAPGVYADAYDNALSSTDWSMAMAAYRPAQIDLSQTIATTTLTYDPSGNLLSNGSLTNTWDYHNYLTQTIVGSGGTSTATIAAVATSSFVYTLFTTGPTTKTWTATTSGSDRLLVLTADIFQDIAGTGSITSATYGGVALNKASSTRQGTKSVEIWYLKNPATSGNTMSVTVTGATDDLKFTTISFTGVDQTTPLESVQATLGTSGNPSVSLTTTNVGDTLVTTLFRHTTADATTSRSSIWKDQSSLTLGAASYTLATGTGVYADTYSGAVSGQNFAMLMAAFKPSASGGGTSTVSTYLYDQNGNRVSLNDGATTTRYWGTTYQDTPAGYKKTKNVYVNGVLVATLEKTGSATMVPYYIATDHLGGTNVVANASGVATETLDYFPYGGVRRDDKQSSFTESRQYIGQPYDETTQLSYLSARYYSGGNGKFISQDPMFTGDPSYQKLTIPQSLNSYNYAEDNPINKKDPDGRTPIDAVYTAYYIGSYVISNSILLQVSQLTGNQQQIDLTAQNLNNALDPTNIAFAIGVANESLPFEGTAAGVTTFLEAKTAQKILSQAINQTEKTGPAIKNTLKPGDFAGESIPARSSARDFTKAEREKINQIGADTGCHTCGTNNAGTKSGNFVLDHQPVTATVPKGTPQQLYPQCISCSRLQGGQARSTQTSSTW